jgi:hypothetical protein
MLSALFTSVFPTLVENATLIGILLAGGIILVELRTVLLALAPEFAAHAKMWAVWFTLFMPSVDIVIDAIELAIYAVRIVVDTLIGRPVPPYPKILWPTHAITADAVSEFAWNLQQCHGFTPRDSVQYAVKRMASSTVCPVRRFAYPIRILNTSLVPALHFWSFDADPNGDSCVSYDDRVADPRLCSMLQVGGVFLEYGLPAMVIALVAISAFPDTLEFIRGVAGLAVDAPRDVIRILEKFA